MMLRMQTPPWYVLTGGPCSGKTTLINELKDRGYSVLPEAARTVIAGQLAQGKTIQDILADALALEKLIVAHQLELESQAPKDKVMFLDRAIPDNLAYYRKFGLTIDKEFTKALDTAQYRGVFLLDMLEFGGDAERYETSQEEAEWLHREFRRAYEERGYRPVDVPVLPVPERADYLLARL